MLIEITLKITFQNEEYGKAINAYSEILKTYDLNDRQKAIILCNRCYSYLFLSAHFLAQLDAEEALMLQPLWWRTYLRMGQVLCAFKKYDESAIYLKKALKYNPNYVKGQKLLEFVEVCVSFFQQHTFCIDIYLQNFRIKLLPKLHVCQREL